MNRDLSAKPGSGASWRGCFGFVAITVTLFAGLPGALAGPQLPDPSREVVINHLDSEVRLLWSANVWEQAGTFILVGNDHGIEGEVLAQVEAREGLHEYRFQDLRPTITGYRTYVLRFRTDDGRILTLGTLVVHPDEVVPAASLPPTTPQAVGTLADVDWYPGQAPASVDGEPSCSWLAGGICPPTPPPRPRPADTVAS